MKPRRTHESTQCLDLAEGNEDNSLWVRVESYEDCGHVCVSSVWEPTEEERAAIADGQNIKLTVWGTTHPPVNVGVTDVGIGKPPPPELNLTETTYMTEKAAITLCEHFMQEYEASSGEPIERSLRCRYLDVDGQEQRIEVPPPEHPLSERKP